jgi:uncharacterized protein (TIGR02186 family)
MRGLMNIRGIRVLNGLISVFVAALTFIVLHPMHSHAQLTARANHDHIKIDFLYHGSTVTVSGISDPGREIAIKITSQEGSEALKKKGKVAGVIWMNTGGMEFKNVPGVYLFTSTKKMADILAPEEMKKGLLGYEALKEHATIEPALPRAERDRWFAEFIKMKEHGKLYSGYEGNVTLTPEGDHQKYFTKFDWPYQAPPGNYLVSVYALKDGKIVEEATAKVLVEQVGVVKALAGMAGDNPALYGIISILSALLAGFGVGLIFRKGGGSH